MVAHCKCLTEAVDFSQGVGGTLSKLSTAVCVKVDNLLEAATWHGQLGFWLVGGTGWWAG